MLITEDFKIVYPGDLIVPLDTSDGDLTVEGIYHKKKNHLPNTNIYCITIFTLGYVCGLPQVVNKILASKVTQ